MSTIQKRKKVTIRDVLDEHELAFMGILESVDGTIVDPLSKYIKFITDSGMRETPEYLSILAKYKGRLKDKEVRKEYYSEISVFEKEFYKKKIEECLGIDP